MYITRLHLIQASVLSAGDSDNLFNIYFEGGLRMWTDQM